jgi:3-hydroxyisobutyrate dehydrogenase
MAARGTAKKKGNRNTAGPVGFIGLGNMGKPMSANLAKAGFDLVCYDIAGTRGRAPRGAAVAGSITDVARGSSVLFISVNSRKAVDAVTAEIAKAGSKTLKSVVDTSTIGTVTAKRAAKRLAKAEIAYVDSPVAGASGGTGIGPAAARAAALTFITAGPAATVRRIRPMLEAMGRKLFVVGTEPGQAQAVKLINNFLIGVAVAATTEAMLYGQRQKLAMKTLLDVINVSSGQNVATSYIFPATIANGRFNLGADIEILTKDVGTYAEEVASLKLPRGVGQVVDGLWQDMGRDWPGVDFSLFYEYIRRGGPGKAGPAPRRKATKSTTGAKPQPRTRS